MTPGLVMASAESLPEPVDYSRLGPRPGTRAVVAGGCSDIGREYTAALVTTGCRVVAFDRPSAIAACPPIPGATILPVDITDENKTTQVCAIGRRANRALLVYVTEPSYRVQN